MYPLCRTVRKATPIFMVGGKRGVLFVHGFTGSPHDFEYMASRVHEMGFTVSVPRLPGHGTCGEDFLKTGSRDWLRRAFDAYYDLSAVCDEVSVVGLSMGGAIAIVLAAALKPKKLVTLAAATHVRDWRVSIAWLVGLFRNRIPKESGGKFEDPELEYLRKEYWSYHWPKQISHLHKIMRMARKCVKQVTSDTLVIAARRDDVVPLEAAEFIYENVKTENKKLLVFEESGHVLTNDVEREAVTNAVINWLL